MRLDPQSIRLAAAGLTDSVREHRRALHRRPELGFAEQRTAGYVESVLDRLGVAHRRVVGTG
ncbi:MAG: amidohydrolase, partial [Actinomycetota bacterium]|nr:amidohydrolase [Actinomycetota bacterium]